MHLDSIRYLNQSTKKKMYRYRDRNDMVIISKHDKHGLAYLVEQTNNRFDLEILLPIEYDRIRAFSDKYEVVSFYKNNLVGYYPFSRDAKYSKVKSTIYPYIRYMTLYNKKGWLNLHSGKEYPD